MTAEHRQKIDEAMRLLEVERAIALTRTVRAYDKLRKAQSAYEEAVLTAHALGLGATAIARELGVSETAVRTFVKRRKDA